MSTVVQVSWSKQSALFSVRRSVSIGLLVMNEGWQFVAKPSVGDMLVAKIENL